MKFNSMQLKPTSFESTVKLTEGEIEDWKGRLGMNMTKNLKKAVVVPGEIEARIVKDNATELLHIQSDDWFRVAFIKSEFDAIIEEFKEPFEKYMKYGIVDGKLVIKEYRNAIITLVGDINGVEVKFGAGSVANINDLIIMLKVMATASVDEQYIPTLTENERVYLYDNSEDALFTIRNLRILSYVFMH